MDYATMMRLEHERTRQTFDWFEAIDSIRRRCSNLSRCLRDAGALCSEFSRGAIVGYDDAAQDEGYARGEPSWTPGCGHPAPGVDQ